MFNRRSRAALFAATILGIAALPAPAAAQRITRIVAFGDSYADDGNLFQLLGAPFPQPFPTGRFSGGTNYIDTLGQILNVPIDNFAIGGALTTQFNTNAGPALGFPTEYQAFLAGGGPAAFPRVSGTFGPNDLLAVSIGGNDARFYASGNPAFGIGPGTVAGAPTAAAASVAAATTGLNALVAAGARNISFLAGDTSILPEPVPPSQTPVRAAYSATFNSGIQTTLAGYAANGVIVNYLDLSLVGRRIIADPRAYGLTGVSCPALPDTSCIASRVLADQFLFYYDQLHLTSAGFAIVARYIDAQLTAPLTLQAASDVGFDTARQFGRTLTARMDLGSPRDGGDDAGLRLFVMGDYWSHSIGTGPRNDEFDVTSVGVTGGLEYGLGNGIVGAAVNYSRPKADFTGNAADNKANSLQIGGYAGFALAGAFAQGYVGYGSDDHDIRRTGVIDDMRAEVDGSHWSAGAKAGYLMPFGGVRVGPVVGIDYAKAKIDGYTESGDSALTLNVDPISYKALVGSAGIELRGDFAGGGVALRPFIAATMEKDFDGDARTLRYAQTSSPGIVNRFPVEDRSKKSYGRLAGGASAAIFNGVHLEAAASSTFGKKQGEEVSAQLGLRVGF